MSGKSAVVLLQYYNAFWYVLQRTAGPSGTMTSCNVLNSSAVCIPCEPAFRTLHYDSTGTVANAKTVFGRKLFLHVAQLCGYYQVRR